MDQTWDRDRSTSSLNESGPGLYFTSSREQAESYGGFLYRATCRPGFKFVPQKKPFYSTLRRLHKEASHEHQKRFRADWGGITGASALRKYLGQSTTYDALLSLYADLFHHDALGWVEAMRALGYDGAWIERPNDVTHLVVWSPLQLNISAA